MSLLKPLSPRKPLRRLHSSPHHGGRAGRTRSDRDCHGVAHVAALLLPALLVTAGTAFAQYKVVGPDGRVTYTDRPPTGAAAAPAAPTPTVAPAAATPAAAGTPVAALPLPLREVATRFPVTLFAAPECAPCDDGRRYLQERGVPFIEKLADANIDREVWRQAAGSSEAPVLLVGQQLLRGYSPAAWASYLDSAGYPAASVLPRSYRAPAPQRFGAPTPPPERAPAARAAAQAPAPTPAAPPPPPANAASGFRF